MAYYGTGNWGLPEFGLTEKYIPKANTSSLYTASQKNNFSGANYTPVPKGQGGYILGTSTVASPTNTKNYSQMNYTPNTSTTTTKKTSSGGGGGGKTGNGNSQEGGSIKTQFNGQWYDSESDARRAEEQYNRAKDAIMGTSTTIKSGLRGLAEKIPGYLSQNEQSLNDMYSTALSGYDTARGSALNKLDISRNKVTDYAKSAITDLQDDLRNRMLATNMQLGAMGAGDSSASQVMAPYAFSKVASASRADVLKDRNQQYADIDTQEQDVITQYDGMKTQLEQEKITALQDVRNWARDQLMQIDQAMVNADAETAQALQSMEVGILNNTYSQLQNLQTMMTQRQFELDDWARNRVAQLNDAKLSLQNSSNFNPYEIMASELPGLSGYGGQGQEEFYNPIALMQKKKQNLVNQ